jgi:hypothetical protein
MAYTPTLPPFRTPEHIYVSSPTSETAVPAVLESAQAHWSPASLDAERRFGQLHAQLFPFLGRKVRTPAGSGTLLQVFVEKVTVLLDSDLDKCSFFAPAQIQPVSQD